MTKPKKTINISAKLHRDLAAMAAERGKTVGQFAEELLLAQVASRRDPALRRLLKHPTRKPTNEK